MEDPPRQPPLRGEGDGHVEEILEGLERVGALRAITSSPYSSRGGSHPPTHFDDGPGPILTPIEHQTGSLDRSFVRAGWSHHEEAHERSAANLLVRHGSGEDQTLREEDLTVGPKHARPVAQDGGTVAALPGRSET